MRERSRFISRLNPNLSFSRRKILSQASRIWYSVYGDFMPNLNEDVYE